MTAPAKRIVSVSIGSSKRDATAELEVLGQRFVLERVGTDGSLEQAARLFRELDGKVAAFGFGGTDLYIVSGRHRYAFRESARLVGNAKITPVLDGSGLKHTLEREAVRQLEPVVGWRGRKTLLVSSVDRFGMAEALSEAGADIVYGDMIFNLNVPVPIRSLTVQRGFARAIMPVVTQLPVKWFSPTGAQQESFVRDWRTRYYDWAEVIAGDFHILNRYRPARLDGKTILTQTITEGDRAALRAAGLRRLITTTPKIGGRNFATNVLEALFVALSGKNRPLSPEEYMDYIRRVGFKPEVEELQEAPEASVR